MSLTTYQKELLTFIKSKGEATSAELVDEFGCRTPYAPNKYVGLALSRMVKNGCLVRVRKDESRQNDTLAPSIHGMVGEAGKTSQLNPPFVAEMMGFPPDWLELPFLSTGKSQ